MNYILFFTRPPSRGSGQANMLTPGKGRSRAESRMGSTSSAEGSAALRVEEVSKHNGGLKMEKLNTNVRFWIMHPST